MKDNRFLFDLPKGWEDQTVYIFEGPKEGETEHRLVLYLNRHLQNADLESFARSQTGPIVDNLSGVEVLKDEDVTLEGCNPCREFVYKWIMAENLAYYHKYIFVIRDNVGFTFSCRFTKMTYKLLGHQMNEVIEALVPGTYQPIEEE